MQLERDLARANIKPFAWIVNQSLTPLDVTDPVLRSRRAHEATHLQELVGHASRIVLEPWSEGFSRREGRSTSTRAPVITV
jgi:arsenite-transporting ATPase